MPGRGSPFSEEERIWITKKFGELKSATKVRRAFRLSFPERDHNSIPKQMQFQRVLDKFDASGDVGDPQVKPRVGDSVPQCDVQAVKDYFTLNDKAHIREAARELGYSIGKIWFILRKILKWRAYRPHTATVLTVKQRKTRLQAAEWFLSHDEAFFATQVLWSDEKYFVLKQGPNKSIHRYWSPCNPHTIIECKTQNQKKAMSWAGLFNGKVIGPYWIEGTMNQYVYRRLLEEQVWPAVRGIARRNQLYFMQDGATCHTTRMNLEFLHSKFQGRVISNKSDIIWPPNSPDCNPLDFFFWGHTMNHVFRINPSTIEDLKNIVNDFAQAMDTDLILKVCASTRTRFEKMHKAKGGHFEHL